MTHTNHSLERVVYFNGEFSDLTLHDLQAFVADTHYVNPQTSVQITQELCDGKKADVLRINWWEDS